MVNLGRTDIEAEALRMQKDWPLNDCLQVVEKVPEKAVKWGEIESTSWNFGGISSVPSFYF